MIENNAVARLRDPEALGRAALTGEPIDVVVSVPVEAFAGAYRVLHPIMDDGAPDLEAWLTEEGRSEDELRLLCGLFSTVSDHLPMDTRHHLTWLELTGFEQHIDEFIAYHIKNAGRKGFTGFFKHLEKEDLASACERFLTWKKEHS